MIDSANREIAEVGAIVTGGKAEAKWTYRYTHDSDHPLKEKPAFKFKVQASRAAAVRSAEVEISAKIRFYLKNIFGKSPENYDIYLVSSDGSSETITADDTGLFEKEDLIPGEYTIKAERKKDE